MQRAAGTGTERRYYHIILETLPKLVMLLECANLTDVHDVRRLLGAARR